MFLCHSFTKSKMLSNYDLLADMDEKDKRQHLVVKESNQDYVHVSDDNKNAYITQTCPCNIQQFFKTVKMINFR